MRRNLGVQLLLDDPSERVESHPQGVGRLAVEPRVPYRQDIDLGCARLDRDCDRGVVGDAAVDVLAASDRNGREHAGDGAAREQGRDCRS